MALVADFTKKDSKQHIVEGIAASSNLDRDKQIIDENFLKNNYKQWAEKYGNIRYLHQPRVVGKVLTCSDWDPVQKGFYITAKISDPDAWRQIEDGELNGFSIGIKNPVIVHDPQADRGRLIDGEVIETSIVDIPASYQADFQVIKSPVVATFDAELKEWKTVDQNDVIVAMLNDDDIDWINAMVDGFGIDDDDTAQFAKRYYSQKERNSMSEEDFAGPHRSFPIKDQEDVDNAARLIGHAKDPDAVKRRIIEIARRKGLKIPEAWKENANKTLDTSSGLQPYNLDGDDKKEEKTTVADENTPQVTSADSTKAAVDELRNVMEGMQTQLSEIRGVVEAMANQVDKDRDGDNDNLVRPEAQAANEIVEEPGKPVDSTGTNAPNAVEEANNDPLGLKNAIIEEVTKSVLAIMDEKFNTVTKSTVIDTDNIKGMIAGLQKSANELGEKLSQFNERLEVVENTAQPPKGITTTAVEKFANADTPDKTDESNLYAEAVKTVSAKYPNLSPALRKQRIDEEFAKLTGGNK
ncbi:XkdF-like putative serine protease domain-containing protein [Alicyclobacillus acidoterrestris]|uniref:XkdF-like putative serine protease domain-containing protein n=1 Tax=Alicyclobacillus acidoterrestris (strain ATCC 49025 / DSM 3922 / CIP 106132 / NCIMB 13137 / GD3B) TaxID=1356854 RepID=T0D817_ALIAG|nr:XkdF-like putative serine protease domain-containing protein [Alicyclobacillus acidoterrestris]EPZ47642.1 hypothetical protein N007_05130 [Alicyclobacillus acidoterrestris ATCC 49025]UNO48038.1 XkdF-like putative serine protease domain-containing protein [Alicyclobacillus acidoterrestris]